MVINSLNPETSVEKTPFSKHDEIHNEPNSVIPQQYNQTKQPIATQKQQTKMKKTR